MTSKYFSVLNPAVNVTWEKVLDMIRSNFYIFDELVLQTNKRAKKKPS